MTPKAIIQGEYHASEKDEKRLSNRRTEDSEALFIEGRSDTIHLVEYSGRYFLFLIGVLLALALSAGRDFDEVGGLKRHSDIDAEYHEIWEKAGETEGRDIRNVLYRTLISVLIIGIIASFLGTIVIPPGSIAAIFVLLIPLILVVGVPIGFSVFIAVLLETEERDRIMAQNIAYESQKNNYSEVLILCGDSHVPGIAAHLEEQGWTVCKERSKHPLSRVIRWLFE